MKKSLHDNVCEKTTYELIYSKYCREIHDFLYYKFGAESSPEDKVQEAFIKLWEHCKKVKPEQARAFLYQVARNMSLNQIKHNNVVLKHREGLTNKIEHNTPEAILRTKEYYSQYKAVLGNMKSEYREAFMLSKVEGKKHEEIANLLGVTKKVVEYRIYTAFSILKKELENFKTK